MSKLQVWIITIVIVSILIGVGIGIYQLKRMWNYKWGYESKVRAEICEMVKYEALRNPKECE